ncbi:cobyric acid synthase [Virgibacillus sp. L01]|uniref:cobyric acid synthase n=1 Tax=Virgibacillus sp. L01 TaxID=3457429 RepID=UPI003FD58199
MKGLMIQGTASNVGKSILTAGLCRLFAKKGYTITPFKAQNMSDQSVLTTDGKEMSIAQAQQAEAAYLDPSVLMNPILLKPREHGQTEVFVLGEKVDSIPGWDYRRSYYDLARQTTQEALNQHDQHSDFIFIEGAGSPVEMNLKDRDLTNMGVARMADVPVMLVTDIDRGGAFASVVGTLELLTQEERNRVKGLIVNKFHGDVSSFTSGREWLEAYTGIPVLGVIPHIDHNLAEEDSLKGLNNSKINSTPSKSAGEKPDYDKLAEHLESHMNWEKLLEVILGETYAN